MNTDIPVHDRSPLPELSDEAIARIEHDVFARISAEDAVPASTEPASARTARRRRSRRTLWASLGTAAAVVVVAAAIAPSVLGGIASDEAGSSAVSPEYAPDAATQNGGTDTGGGDLGGSDGGGAASEESALPGDQAGREIIANGSMSLTVDDVGIAADAVAGIARERGGYVEQLEVGGKSYADPAAVEGMYTDDAVSVPVYTGGSWVQVRIPADELDDAMEAVGRLGVVDSSSVMRQDVTDQSVDLRAQVDAAEASVERLTELMAEATSVADLLAAESALAERQALLDGYRQQLEMLEGQVAMSTLSVSLAPRVETVEANPAGFGDGIAAGWNGLVATLNGVVVGLGFLLPWLAVAAVAVVVVWLVRRSIRRRRDRTALAASDLEEGTEADSAPTS